MDWQQVKTQYPEQWLLVEALEAHTTDDHKRHLDQLAVVEQCTDGTSAFQRYQALHRKFPEREYYYVHTSRQELDIVEEVRLGPRLGV